MFALEAAWRGIEAGIVIPPYLSGDLLRYRACPAKAVCLPDASDLMEWFLPGEADFASRLARVLRAVNGLHPETVRRVLTSLHQEMLLSCGVLSAFQSPGSREE